MSPLSILLNDSEKSYLTLFRLSPQPMWVYNINDLRFLDVNDAAVKHYGYSREEFLSMTLLDIRPEEDKPIFEEALKTIIEIGPDLTSQVYRHKKKNGEVIDVQILSNAIDFKNINARLILVNDITSIIRSEKEVQTSKEELLKSEKRFKALVQEGSDVTGIMDAEGNYLFVSENVKSILNFNPEDFIGRNALEFVHPDDVERLGQALQSLAHLKRIDIQPFRFRYGQAEWRWLATTVTNMLDDPAVAGLVTNSKDVTESIHNSLELKLSNERYKLVLKASDEAICDWDIENDIVDWGSGFHDMFGYDLSVYNNTLWSDNIHPDDRKRVLKEVVTAMADKNKEIYYSEYRFLKANREVIHIQHRGIFLRDTKGKAIRSVDTLKDITAHKQRLEHIEKQNEQLRQIAWTQSHNVRDPLARIMALADLLEAEECIPEPQKDILKHLIRSAADLDEAIRAVIKKTL